MEKNKRHILLRVAKVSLWVLLSVSIILVGLRLSLKTNFVHNYAKAKIENVASESLTTGFSISELNGDLWKEIELVGVYVGDEDTLAYIDTLYTSYNVLSLLGDVFYVDQVRVSQGKLNAIESNLTQDSTTSFNVQEVIKVDNSESETDSKFKFSIKEISLKRMDISVYSPSLLPDSALKIQDVSLQAGFSMTEEIEASLSELSFNIKEGRLPETVQIKASGSYADQTITLEDLLLNTGKSLLQANAFVDLKDSVLNSNIDLKPISTLDIQPYVDQEVPKEEFEINLKAKGSLADLELQLTANSNSLREIEAIAQLSFSGTPTLTQFGLKGSGLNIAALTNDSIDVSTGVFQVTLDGELTNEYKEADITWGFTVEGLRYEDYYLRRFFGSGSLKKGKVLANLDITTSGEERLTTNTDIENIFSDTTKWKIGYHLKNFNAAYWVEGFSKTNVSLNGFINGKGFELSSKKWEFSISNSILPGNDPSQIRKWEDRMNTKAFSVIEIGDQSISFLRVGGTLDKDSVSIDGFTDIEKSRINFKATASEFLSELPSFKYEVSAKDFNANEIAAIEDLSTSLNMRASGNGSGNSIENLTLKGFAHIDSSLVNGASIDFLDASYELEEGILIVKDAEFRSEIANIDFSVRKNIMDQKDPDNILSFDAELKNTQPFAPLVDLQILQISGSLSADIKEAEEGFLQCVATFNLIDIIADDLFRASNIDGNGVVNLKEKEEGIFEISIKEPIIAGTAFQDISISTNSFRSPDSLIGDYSIEIKDDDNGQILNAGSYELEFSSMNANIIMKKLDFITKDNKLSLQEEFNITAENGAIKTDSLTLTSSNGAFLSLSIPYADSLNQQIWLVGENFNFGILQEIILGERFVDGVLFGQLNVNKSEYDLNGSGNLELQNIEYEGVQADVFSLSFNTQDKRLQSELSLIWDKQKVISGSLDIPIDLSNPENISDEFFTQSISGSLNIQPTSLSRFKTVMEKLGITETEGVISFDGNLSGTAGTPNFEGTLQVKDPVLSSVPLDSVFTEFRYSQEKENIFINTEIIAAKQKAADINIDVPFSYNFKTFEVNMVDENKPISATITTKDFNLAVFNDFLDKKTTKNLKGILNGELILKGSENDISSNGYFALTKSSLEIPIAGITLSGIQSHIEFTPSKILLKEFVAKSGKGEFKANGDINLDGLKPTTVDIQARANQFKMANTTEYNMVVDMDSRLSGPAFTPTATGRFAVKNGFILLDNFGDKAVEEIQLEGEQTDPISFYDSLAIEMEFEIERNFFVRNRKYLDMEIEISGRLDAQKETRGELSLFGSLTGKGGYLRPLGKRFELEEADLAFTGPPANPDLNIKSVYMPASYKGAQEVSLYYIIKGTAENPIFSFESTPKMEQQDIVCYTLFNRPCYALESWQNAITEGGGASPTDLLAGVLIDEVEALATRELGVDVVQIDNTRVGNETGTSIKTGWYLNERTFFAIVNEITSSDPKTLFILEYALSKTWDLVITEGEDSNRRGVDFKWQYDY